jgi:predicted CopG family antitoxin
MNKIIEKTYELIDALDNSDIIRNLVYYKKKLGDNKEVLELVNKYNNTKDDNELIKIKRELYNDREYKNYLDNYNKLHNIVLKINYRYRKILNSRSCNNACN